ncbi:hypothetical protein [Vibrio diazotrophicus]|uniref:hypothetical protein n=1 Tax=Vibrio diazotrophicus TaxID=685 RepID=UPI003D2F592E
MASFGSYPQNVTFQTVNVSAGGGSENLLINPRGKINQANEPDGVLSAGQYFCDGWKAGAAGAEVYIDPDGFRLISGSIVQLVPNNLEAGRTIRGNMDIISGAPVISINGGADNVLSDAAEYIQFEVSGNNSKFTRLILAESVSLPIYQQSVDELPACKKFVQKIRVSEGFLSGSALSSDGTSYKIKSLNFSDMTKIPAATVLTQNHGGTGAWVSTFDSITKSQIVVRLRTNTSASMYLDAEILLDARP